MGCGKSALSSVLNSACFVIVKSDTAVFISYDNGKILNPQLILLSTWELKNT